MEMEIIKNEKTKNVIIAVIVLMVIGIGGYLFNKCKLKSKDSINTIILPNNETTNNLEKDSITIKTNLKLCDTDSIIDSKDIFNIEKNKKLKLRTPTLDAQKVYEIEIK